ncbi:hypothetical protein E2C01_006860 [Portunus trituberculatus]|uniref:Uncharacterized protein n=1 Tax=Portunus trituberculatus TaxID=210409 RepID=A0A5B7CW92_PORTR|nr:hypothetical protein [Portunus trituberculatus]
MEKLACSQQSPASVVVSKDWLEDSLGRGSLAKLSKSWKYKTKFSFEDCQKNTIKIKKRNIEVWPFRSERGLGPLKRIGVNPCQGRCMLASEAVIMHLVLTRFYNHLGNN